MKQCRALTDFPMDGRQYMPGDDVLMEDARAEKNAARGLVEIVGDAPEAPQVPVGEPIETPDSEPVEEPAVEAPQVPKAEPVQTRRGRRS